MRIGILIIGSLYWEMTEYRGNWRENRLDVAGECHVRVPIRYGRRSRNRGWSFTMVVSPGLSEDMYGQAIVRALQIGRACRRGRMALGR